MVFSSHKLVFVLNIEITGTFYRLGNRSACPHNLTPPKKECRFYFCDEGKFKHAPGSTLI